MRIKRTLVFIVEMALIFILFLLAGRLPAVVKMNWDYMIVGDPAWRWVVNIIVATLVTIIVSLASKKSRFRVLFSIVGFVLALILMESFAWHAQETIAIIKGTTIFSGIKGVLFTALSAIIAFILHLNRYTWDDGSGDGEE